MAGSPLAGGRGPEAPWRSAAVAALAALAAARREKVVERVVFGGTAGRLLACRSASLPRCGLAAAGRIVRAYRVPMVTGDGFRMVTGDGFRMVTGAGFRMVTGAGVWMVTDDSARVVTRDSVRVMTGYG
jgi:hypothetical protein